MEKINSADSVPSRASMSPGSQCSLGESPNETRENTGRNSRSDRSSSGGSSSSNGGGGSSCGNSNSKNHNKDNDNSVLATMTKNFANIGSTSMGQEVQKSNPSPSSPISNRPESPFYYQRTQRIDSDIYVACDRLTKTNYYAIKLFQLDQLDDIDFKLMTHEIQICNQLKHPNILQYLYNFTHQDQIWIVTPLCAFTSADRLSKPFGMPELAIAFIIRDTLNALKYLHLRGIIHRSVRGSHILINSAGRCLLSGLKYSVNCIADGKWQPYMHEYPLKARPNINWFSPEILEQNLFGYNHKSDIYSLGITCCELANGVVPFSDLQPTEMLLDKLTGNAPRLLDQSCQELVNLKPNEMTPEDRDKYFVFRGRQFSTAFHTFTSGLCMNFDPQKRPDAGKLLSHNFIKQVRKSPATSLLDFLDPSQQIVYRKQKSDGSCSVGLASSSKHGGSEGRSIQRGN